MPSISEKIKKALKENPNQTNGEVAAKFKTSHKYVSDIRSQMRSKGEIPPLPEDYKSGQTIKQIIQNHEGLANECETSGIPLESVKHYWYKGKHFSIFSKTKEVNYDDLMNDVTEKMRKYSPKYQKIKYTKPKDGHLLVISPADLHLGKLAKAFETWDEYNHKIAIERVKNGVHGILQKASGFPIEKIILIVGNDILHVDNAKSSTTSGTHQDTDLMWFDAFNIALELYVWVIETLSQIAPVHIDYNPSNHDYLTGFFLANTLKAWFRNHNGVTMNVSISHRKYSVYGKNLIGSTHGDGAKEADLPMLMAHEAKEYWNTCVHRYFYAHHIHHKKSKDYMSVCVEYLRSPSGTDSWHHRNAFQHAPKAIEGFIHHPEHGQVARITHLF